MYSVQVYYLLYGWITIRLKYLDLLLFLKFLENSTSANTSVKLTLIYVVKGNNLLLITALF